MTDVQRSDLRAQLETERADLLSQLAELGVGADAGDALTYDANFADSSQVTAEKGETEALAATLQESLEAVDAALHRMEAGTYGLCARCQTPIAPARLEAMPSATRCIEHAS
ncbi:MAG: TraR/DksA C4-type zinc finger protein, partial [Acidimicrobiales bacterium]